MTLKSIIEALSPYKKIIFVVIGCFFGLLFMAWLFMKAGEWLDNHDREQDKLAINALVNDANVVKSNLSNLRINEAVKEQETNIARNAYYRDMEKTNQARQRANSSLSNVNAIEAANYANKSLQDALNARCAAFPQARECRDFR